MFFKKFTFVIVCGITFSVAAMDKQPTTDIFTIPSDSIRKRAVVVPFESMGQHYLIVRSDKADLNGFREKHDAKQGKAREIGEKLFGIGQTLQNLVYLESVKEDINFKNYKLGLFSIYQLQTDMATFVGELYLDQNTLASQGNFSEISTDIHPDFQRRGIGRSSKDAFLKNLINPLLGQKVYLISQLAGNKFELRLSPKKLDYIKSKVAFDNFPMHRINISLRFKPSDLTLGNEVTYTYPPQHMSPNAEEVASFIANLTSDSEPMRKEAIEELNGQVQNIKYLLSL